MSLPGPEEGGGDRLANGPRYHYTVPLRGPARDMTCARKCYHVSLCSFGRPASHDSCRGKNVRNKSVVRVLEARCGAVWSGTLLLGMLLLFSVTLSAADRMKNGERIPIGK